MFAGVGQDADWCARKSTARSDPQSHVRILAATNRPLDALLAAGQFREDLFYRLSVFSIHAPPLREHPDDIPALARHFLERSRLASAPDVRLTDDVLDALRARTWPGNVRELRNAIEHAAIVSRGGPIGPEHLPAGASRPTAPAAPPSEAIAATLGEWARREVQALRSSRGDPVLYERFLELTEPPVLRAVLNACHGHRADAAELLGIHRATLRQKLKKYGIA